MSRNTLKHSATLPINSASTFEVSSFWTHTCPQGSDAKNPEKCWTLGGKWPVCGSGKKTLQRLWGFCSHRWPVSEHIGHTTDHRSTRVENDCQKENPPLSEVLDCYTFLTDNPPPPPKKIWSQNLNLIWHWLTLTLEPGGFWRAGPSRRPGRCVVNTRGCFKEDSWNSEK